MFNIDKNLNNISDPNAEKSVLGSMILSQDAIANVCCILKSEDFFYAKHKIIYDTIVSIYTNNQPIDTVILAHVLGKTNLIDQIGGVIYLHKLIQLVPTVSNVTYYANIVLEKSILRKLNIAGLNILKISTENNKRNVNQTIELAQKEILNIQKNNLNQDYMPVSHIIKYTIEKMQSLQNKDSENGIATGFIELDNVIHGLQDGQMIVIAARPSVGKSTFALDILRNVSIKNNIPSILFSLEMEKNEIAMKLLAAESKINLQDIRKSNLNTQQWEKLKSKILTINPSPLFIDDSSDISIIEIRSKCRRLKQQQGLKLIILDYLQLLSSNNRTESRQQEVSDFSRNLKLFAKELKVPIVALSQLNRASEQRINKRPMLADLRESGCLSGDVRLLFINKQSITLKELYNQYKGKEINFPVWAICLKNNCMQYVSTILTKVFANGIKSVYKLTLQSGKSIKTTLNHMFFLFKFGWTQLINLKKNDLIIVPVFSKSDDRFSSSPRYTFENIENIIYIGEEKVYDVTVLDQHNFIANEITVHNSIEQDADIVMLLHREEMYNKNSNRIGEADLILAKNRNGPTKNIILSFQGHYSRFVNISKDSWRNKF